MSDRTDLDDLDIDLGDLPDDVETETRREPKPDWWTAAIEQHREYDLLPYEPPRLGDGVLKHRLVRRLEAAYDIDIRFVGVDVRYGDEWEIRVDGDAIETVTHERTPMGYSVYHIDSDDLLESVRAHLE